MVKKRNFCVPLSNPHRRSSAKIDFYWNLWTRSSIIKECLHLRSIFQQNQIINQKNKKREKTRDITIRIRFWIDIFIMQEIKLHLQINDTHMHILCINMLQIFLVTKKAANFLSYSSLLLLVLILFRGTLCSINYWKW